MQIQSKALNAILKRLQPAIHPSPVLPVLEYVLVSNGKITATNLNITISHDIGTEETLLLPFSKLLNITGITDGELSITQQQVTCGKSKWDIGKAHDITTFPAIPVFEGDEISVKEDFFEALFNADKCRMKTTVSNIAETVCIDFKNGAVVGTDTIQLYKHDVAVTGSIQCNVDTMFIRATALLTDAVIRSDNKFISASEGAVNIVCRLTEGKYLDYKSVLPQGCLSNFTVNKQLLINGLKQLTVDKTMVPVFKIKFNNGFIKLSFTEINTGENAVTEVACTHTVDFSEIALNINLLLNLLSCVDADEVSFVFDAPNKGVYILDGKKTMVLWPVTI